jgi:hypothetical protein
MKWGVLKMCKCEEILEWVNSQLNEYPEENLSDFEVYSYATLTLVKRQIEQMVGVESNESDGDL